MKQIFILLFSILLISCGARKVTIQEIKKDSLSLIYTKIGTKEITNSETKNNIITDEFIITPLDTCKDIIINGVTYKNVVLRHINTKDNSLHIEKKIISKIEDKQQFTKVLEKSKVKTIEKPFNPLGYIVLIVLAYFIWKYFKI